MRMLFDLGEKAAMVNGGSRDVGFQMLDSLDQMG